MPLVRLATFVMIPVLALAFLVSGCRKDGPLANCPRPDRIFTTCAGVRGEVTNPEDIATLVRYFSDYGERWRPYQGGVPAPDVTAVFERGATPLASVYIGPDWVIVTVTGSPARSFTSSVSATERHILLQLLWSQRHD
jgi:hypothetical protein